jgi:uncharacterized protein
MEISNFYFSAVVTLLFSTLLGGCGIEKRFIFFPEKRIVSTPADAGLDFEELYLSTPDGVRIHAWFIPAPDSRKTLLWFHGNGGNISHRVGHLRLLRQALKISVLMVEYRGYGQSDGTVTEEGTYRDALTAYDYLLTRPEIERGAIVVYGQSLGAAVAVEVAVQRNISGLILEAPFTSIREMAKVVFPWLPIGRLLSTRYDVLSKIGRVTAPLLVFHGDQDEVVPYALGQQVFKAAADPKTFYPIPGAGHNNIYSVGGQDYWRALSQFTEGLPIP